MLYRVTDAVLSTGKGLITNIRSLDKWRRTKTQTLGEAELEWIHISDNDVGSTDTRLTIGRIHMSIFLAILWRQRDQGSTYTALATCPYLALSFRLTRMPDCFATSNCLRPTLTLSVDTEAVSMMVEPFTASTDTEITVFSEASIL